MMFKSKREKELEKNLYDEDGLMRADIYNELVQLREKRGIPPEFVFGAAGILVVAIPGLLYWILN
jgi:hypothetical protein